MAKKKKNEFICQECGYISPKYLGRCPNCGNWNTLVEEMIQEAPTRHSRVSLTGETTKPQKLDQIVFEKETRVKTDLDELNRVLGGGVVPGSMVLIGGDPGIGKSTLLLQVSQQLSKLDDHVLYVSGEESAQQIKMRAERLSDRNNQFYVYSETDMGLIKQTIEQLRPNYVVIDSIQTMVHPDITSAAGSVSQV